jgi:LytS/YehU family sensor histidine kinase
MGLISMLWYTQQEQKENERRKTDAERLAREAELYNLRQQLQPHFLFNSLNSISALIGRRPDEARTMIYQLSDFLRGTLRKEENEFVSLEEELQHLQLYLDIEKVRFGHRLKTEISKEDGCANLILPAMLLQPLVENAIKFGLYDTTGEVTITIDANCHQNYLMLVIQNPYDVKTVRPNSGTGFGLGSIKRRLYLLFARTDLLDTNGENDIFTTTVKIPQA